MNARAVPVRFLVGSDAPERHVGFDGLVDHAKYCALRAAAAVEAAGIGLAYAHVGDEVGRPLLRRRFLLEVTFFGVIAVAKDERVVEDEFIIVERIDHPRRAGHRDVARGIQAGGVMMFMPRIHRYREVTSLLPLESFLSVRIDPNRRPRKPGMTK